jgi:mannan endo-1,4-beta-mannosidase
MDSLPGVESPRPSGEGSGRPVRRRRYGSPFSLAARGTALVLVVVVGLILTGVSTSRDSAITATHLHRSHLSQLSSPPSAAVHLNPSPGTTAPVSTSPSTNPAPATTLPATTAPPTTTSTAPAQPRTATPTPTTNAAPADSTDIGASGIQLYLNGSAYRFVGVNAYEAATEWGTNAGCGSELSDDQLDQLFSSLQPNSLVRIWAFQGSMATDVSTGQLNWGPLDRVFAAAAAHGQRLIVSLTDQGGTCDGGHWQDPSWYEGGFMNVYNDPTTTDGRGLTPLSYWSYLQAIVARYRSSPALGMWEPISEAEASTCPPTDEPLNCSGNQTCPNEAVAASALRHFYDVVGAEIHSLDPNHLVESGLLGGGQCGTQGADYEMVSASPGIDVLSYHDYWGITPIGGDQWNGLQVRLNQAIALGKPIIAGEAGLQAGTGPGCISDEDRNQSFAAKERAQFRRDASGLLAWNWVPAVSAPCSYDIAPNDPMMQPGGAID